MTISDIKKIKWQFYGEWRDKWYDDELCLKVLNRGNNPLAKLFNSSGLNSLIVGSKWFFEEEGLAMEDENIQGALRREEDFVEELVCETKKYIKKAESIIKKLEVPQETNVKVFVEAKKGMLALWCVFLCDLGEDLGQLVDLRLKTKGFTKDQTEEIKNYFFSASDKLVYREAEENLRRIALLYQKKFGQRKVKINDLPENFKKELDSHREKFGWLTNLDVDSKPTMTRDLLSDIWEFNTVKKGKQKKAISQKLRRKLSSQDTKLLKLVGQHIYLDNLAAERYARLDFLSTILLSKKFNIPFQDLAWYSFTELETLVKKGIKVSAEDLKERKQFRIMVQINGKLDTFYDLKAYGEISTLVGGLTQVKKVDKFSGLVACRGKVSGQAKIVKEIKDMDKVNEGDILVAGTTRPDLMRAIRRCAAIITDTGGITSHAAIISRELGLPCIVGTKIATQVLRNGDLVEVDADEGVVRIIK